MTTRDHIIKTLKRFGYNAVWLEDKQQYGGLRRSEPIYLNYTKDKGFYIEFDEQNLAINDLDENLKIVDRLVDLLLCITKIDANQVWRDKNSDYITGMRGL